MSRNDLNNPLRSKSRRVFASRRPVLAPALVAAALLVAMLAAFWVAVVDDPDGGRSVAMADIGDAAPASTGSIAGAKGADQSTTAREAFLPQDGSPGGVELAGLPTVPPTGVGNAGLIEPSAFGPLPRVSPDGRRPRMRMHAARPPPIPVCRGWCSW